MPDSVPFAGTERRCEWASLASSLAPVAIRSVVAEHLHRSVDSRRMLLRMVHFELVAGTIAGIVRTVVVSYGIAVVY